MLIRIKRKSHSPSGAVSADSADQRGAGRARSSGNQIARTRICRVEVVCPHRWLKIQKLFLIFVSTITK